MPADGVEGVPKIDLQKGDGGVSLILVDDSLCRMNKKRYILHFTFYIFEFRSSRITSMPYGIMNKDELIPGCYLK